MTKKRKTPEERAAALMNADRAGNIEPVGPGRSARTAPAERAEPLTSVSVPREMLNRLRLMAAQASANEGTRVVPYMILGRALDALDAQKSRES